MSEHRTTTPFEIHIEAAATPQRVAQAAQLVAKMFEGTPDGEDPAVTLEIHNYDLRALVHPRTADGRAATQLFVQFLKNPARCVRKTPKARQFARVLAENLDSFTGTRVTIVQRRRAEPLAVLDGDFRAEMRALAQLRQRVVLRGTDEVLTRIYRIGTTGEGRGTKVRMMLDGTPQEVPMPEDLPHEVRSAFFDFLKSGELALVTVDVGWVRGDEGLLLPDAQQCRVQDIAPGSEGTGAEVVEAAAGGSLFVTPLSQRIAEIEGRYGEHG